MGQRRRGNKGEGFAEVTLAGVVYLPLIGGDSCRITHAASKPDGVTQPVIDGGMDIAGMHRIADP
jgi:hypothetical protein